MDVSVLPSWFPPVLGMLSWNGSEWVPGEVTEALQRCESLHHLIHGRAGLGVPAEAVVGYLGQLLDSPDGVVQLQAGVHYLEETSPVSQPRPGPDHQVLLPIGPALVHCSSPGQDLQDHHPKTVDVALGCQVPWRNSNNREIFQPITSVHAITYVNLGVCWATLKFNKDEKKIKRKKIHLPTKPTALSVIRFNFTLLRKFISQELIVNQARPVESESIFFWGTQQNLSLYSSESILLTKFFRFFNLHRFASMLCESI